MNNTGIQPHKWVLHGRVHRLKKFFTANSSNHSVHLESTLCLFHYFSFVPSVPTTMSHLPTLVTPQQDLSKEEIQILNLESESGRNDVILPSHRIPQSQILFTSFKAIRMKAHLDNNKYSHNKKEEIQENRICFHQLPCV